MTNGAMKFCTCSCGAPGSFEMDVTFFPAVFKRYPNNGEAYAGKAYDIEFRDRALDSKNPRAVWFYRDSRPFFLEDGQVGYHFQFTAQTKKAGLLKMTGPPDVYDRYRITASYGGGDSEKDFPFDGEGPSVYVMFRGENPFPRTTGDYGLLRGNLPPQAPLYTYMPIMFTKRTAGTGEPNSGEFLADTQIQRFQCALRNESASVHCFVATDSIAGQVRVLIEKMSETSSDWNALNYRVMQRIQ